MAVAYRSGAGGLRDPALAVSLDGGASFARDTIVSHDDGPLEACPGQGAALTWNRAGGGHYAWLTGSEPAGVCIVPWRQDVGAGGLRRTLADSVTRAAHPRLAPLGAATLIGVEARPPGDSARTVLAVRLLEPDGSLTAWIFLGADARSAAVAGASPRTGFACWVERAGGGDRVRAVRLSRSTRR